ncbi:MAG: alpha/beta fold hydrolase [Gammaproteobacteria bacterium]|nr:alpha/beta fold hydrolase [Gammaproteobacteria bacterium]
MQQNQTVQQESLFVEQGHHKLHLRHIWCDSEAGVELERHTGTPILMVHGAIENGLIFYTKKGKGLACYLAQQGFDVYVADLRGRGLSTPAIHEDPEHGQHESIVEDIPALAHFIKQKTQQDMHIVCHSWGGVLTSSAMTRNSELRDSVKSLLCFGTKRQVTVWNLERLLKVELFWHRAAQWITKRKGYLDAVKLKAGSDNETHKTLTQGANWVKRSQWVDSEDGFNYANAAQSTEWPPTWHITGVSDKVLGHAQDVQLFIKESNQNAKFSNLSKAIGNALDYDHINILTHPKAVNDHFPEVAEWLKQHS